MKATFNEENYRLAKRRKRMAGVSMVEVIIVLVIIGILSAISIPYIFQSRTRYRSEDQALKVMDLMREAGQMAITRRRTFRLEIDRTNNQVLIIDETGQSSATTDDQQQIKAIPLDPVNETRVDTIPTGVTKPNPPNYNDATFAADTIGHKDANGSNVTGNTVWALRFKRDGSVVSSTDTPISANLYFYPPQTTGSSTPRSLAEVRAVTIFGGSGAIRYWKHNGTTFVQSS